MGRHVVIALSRVLEERISIWRQPREETFQVTLNLGVSILLNQERRGGVLKVQCEQAGLEFCLGEQCLHCSGEIVKTSTTSRDLELKNPLFQSLPKIKQEE